MNSTWNNVWNKNISAFKIRFPGLAQLYSQIIDTISQADENALTNLFSFINIVPAKNGSPTAFIPESNSPTGQKISLHSAYNPEREGQQAAQKIIETGKKSVIFLGCGLGYQITELVKNQAFSKTNSKLSIIEPDPGYFFAALCYVDWTEVFTLNNLILAIGCPAEQLMGLLENSQNINIGDQGVSAAAIFSIPAFTIHAQNYFDTAKTLIERNKTKNDINAATYDKFAKLWIRNSLINAEQIKNRRTVNDIKKTFLQTESSIRKKQFILIAAGPSLETVLPELKEMQKSAVLVCVETALRSLLQQNIQPDFILLTDPQYWAYRHISSLKAPCSTLICPISVYPAVFRFKCKEIILCSDMFPVSQFYETKLGSFCDLGAGGSVASSAWNFCREMGAEKIFLAGLDLSYPSKQTHIRGSSAEQTFHAVSSKTRSVEKSSLGSMYSAYPEYGQNYLGQKVLTDSRMKMFAWWFESRFAACPEITTYTLTPQSMKIPGVLINNNNFITDTAPEKELNPQSSNNCTTNPVEKRIQPADFEQLKNLFNSELSKLGQLVNTAVEKCIINAPELKEQLNQIELQIEQQINETSIKEIIRLAKPGSKYLEEHKTNPPELAIWQKLQEAVHLYNTSL